MNNHYRVYAIEEKDRSSDRIRREWTRGCNGEKHVDYLDKVFYSEEGVVEYAEKLETVERGACDNTCGTERRGRFLYPPSPVARSESS